MMLVPFIIVTAVFAIAIFGGGRNACRELVRLEQALDAVRTEQLRSPSEKLKLEEETLVEKVKDHRLVHNSGLTTLKCEPCERR